MLPYQLNKILFIDIETVPQCASLSEMNETMQHLWQDKHEQVCRRQQIVAENQMTAEDAFANGAGVFAEFGKIVCISVGFIFYEEGQMRFRVKSYASNDEEKLLKAFTGMAAKFLDSNQKFLCGHNIKEFDIPYICRRMLVHGVELPMALQIAGKKPWETTFIDTLELWKFGDYKHYTSLKLLTALFNIPTPKDDIDGSQVSQVFYQEDNLERIAIYCEKDVIATARLYMRICGLPLIEDELIEHVPLQLLPE